MEPPETCPQCDAENWDDEAEQWLCKEHPGFCSVKCAKEWQRQEDAADAQEDLDALADEEFEEVCREARKDEDSYEEFWS